MSTVIDKITSPQQPAENIRETERVCESRKAEEQPKTAAKKGYRMKKRVKEDIKEVQIKLTERLKSLERKRRSLKHSLA